MTASTLPPPPTAFPVVEIGSDEKPTFSPLWLQWFLEVAATAQNGGTGFTAPVQTITATGSPFSVQNQNNYDIVLVINGGTVSKTEMSRDGTTYHQTGAGTNIIAAYLSPQDFARITYTVAPTITGFPT